MNSKIKKQLQALARCLITEDYESAEAFLAVWLRDGGAARLENAAKGQSRAAREMCPDDDLGNADSFELDECPITADELREDGVALPAQISAANYRGWYEISIQSDDGEWSLYDLWCALVEDEGHLAVGYYEITSPD